MRATERKKVLLITGGAGFIGCEIAHRLGTAAGPIVAVDTLHRQIHPFGERPARLPDFVELLVEDIRDAAFWQRFFETHEPGVLIHLAAETGTGQSLTQSSRHASANVTGTTEMLDALSAAGLKPAHILLASSRAVYGEGGWLRDDGSVFYPQRRSHRQLASGIWACLDADGRAGAPQSHRADRTQPAPSSVYGATKLAQEHILSAWASAMDVPLSILRFQNVYGPGQSPFNPYTGIITLFHRQAHSGQAINVYEDGKIGRDFVFIDDVVGACVAALAKAPEGIRTLDVGFGAVTTILDAARMIARLHDAPEPQISGNFRDGDIRWAVADIYRLTAELGVKPTIDFEQGCRLVGDWLAGQGYL